MNVLARIAAMTDDLRRHRERTLEAQNPARRNPMVDAVMSGAFKELEMLRARLAEANAANATLAHEVFVLRLAAQKDADALRALRTLVGAIPEPQPEGGA